jgi:hypothetical protein
VPHAALSQPVVAEQALNIQVLKDALGKES